MRASAKTTLSAIFLGLVLVGLGLVFPADALKIEDVILESEGGEEVLFDRIRSSAQPRLQSLKGRYLWQVDLNEVLKTIADDKRVEDVHVKRQLPNRITARVKPYRPVLSLMAPDGAAIPVAKDASLLPKTLDYTNLPVLRGSGFEKNAELRATAVRLVEELPKSGPMSAERISEIKFDAKDGFYLYLTGSGTLVKLGDDEFARRSSLVERVLNYLENHQMQARVIDARFSKKVVVRLRNAP